MQLLVLAGGRQRRLSVREVFFQDGQAGRSKASDLAVAASRDLGLRLDDRLAVSLYLEVRKPAIEVGAAERRNSPERPLLQGRGRRRDCDSESLRKGRSLLERDGVVGHQMLRKLADLVCGCLGQSGLSARDLEEVGLDVHLEPALV